MTVPSVPGREDQAQQVFKPVPTDQDMHALSDRLARAQRGRVQLLLASIFLAGIVVAAAIALALMYSYMTTRLDAAERALEAQSALLAQRERVIAQREQVIAEQRDVLAGYAGFQSIAALQTQNEALEADIAALLNQASRANAPARLRELPPEVGWIDETVSALRARREALRLKKAEVEAWPPPLQDPRPD